MERPAHTAETLPEYPMSVEEIMAVIPHRYPFLFVDRVTHMDPGKAIRGIKNVSFDEPFFQGHFPGKPILPGVIAVEAMAQIGCILVNMMPEGHNKLIVLAGIEKTRFRRPILPGDQMELKATLLKIRPPIGRASGQVLIDGQLALEGEILFSILPKPV